MFEVEVVQNYWDWIYDRIWFKYIHLKWRLFPSTRPKKPYKTVPMFEIVCTPMIPLSDIKERRFGVSVQSQ